MRSFICLFTLSLILASAAFGDETHKLSAPASCPAFEEDWSSGQIDPAKWYILQKMWGNGNNGVVKQNVFIAQDTVNGQRKNVLICRGHGDNYQGSVTGWEGNKTRVGGVIVSKPFFASGQFEVVMKIGGTEKAVAGPEDPVHPVGMLPALWVYAYRWITPPAGKTGAFNPASPLYNPLLEIKGQTGIMYWSELDFPEFGKQQNHEKGLYNTFLNLNHHSKELSTKAAIDGQYHTFTTIWRTELVPIHDISDRQVAEYNGYWWIQDKAVPYEKYRGQPLKRLGGNRYALYQGKEVRHFIDGQFVGVNETFVPSMAAQLNLGVWFPFWAGAAPWGESSISIASVKVWQFNDPGDVRGILTEDIGDNMNEAGKPL